MPENRERCIRNHRDWHIGSDGRRRCMECRRLNDRNRKDRRKPGTFAAAPKLRANTLHEDTFSRSEILKARGYVA